MRLTLVILALGAFLALQNGAAEAMPGASPRAPTFRVVVAEKLSPAQLRHLASLGAVGLLVPGVGPTINRRRALAGLVRGAEMNAQLGGVPAGKPLISVSRSAGPPVDVLNTIVLELPPPGRLRPNDERYPVIVIGHGFHGLLKSKTTRIDGLVSVVDVAPTALARARGGLASVASASALKTLQGLDRQIRANNRLKLPILIILACLIALCSLTQARAAMTALLASLLVSVFVGASGISSEPLIIAVFIGATVIGALAFARAFDTEGRLLVLIVAVLTSYLLLLIAKPAWVAVTPLGPTQNSRFWGIGNQLETLLLAPLLTGAALALRRFGILGFAGVSAFGLLLMTDNRLGSDGGGAIVLGVALSFLGARALRLGAQGFVTLLLLAAGLVLGVVSFNLQAAGPNHLRSAFTHGGSGMLAVVEHRLPLSYGPAFHDWPFALPLLLCFAFALVAALRVVRGRLSRDVLLALGLAIGASLLVNDSAAYVLAAGVAAIAAVATVQPARVPRFATTLARLPLVARPIATKARD